MTDNNLMPFGKYKGTKMANVPADYLLWLHDQFKQSGPLYGNSKMVNDYIEENFDVLEGEIKKDE